MITYPAWRSFALFFTVLCTFIQSPISLGMPIKGDLLITEVMANPSQVTDGNGEWFEIINTSSAAIDLNGLVVKDRASNHFTVNASSPLFIDSGAYFVFGRNGEQTANGGYKADYDYGNFTLGNSSDAIILEYANVIIDLFDYNQTAVGASAELTASGFSTTPGNFVYGAGDTGTPGMQGSYNLQPITVAAVPLSLIHI